MSGACCIDQILGGGQYPHEDCGESCVVSIKVDDGQTDTERLEEQFDILHNDNPNDGTGGDVHRDSLIGAGIPAHVDTNNTADVLAHARLSGLNRVMVAIDSDHGGYPSPGSGLGHWILWVGDENYMQPVGGTLQYYPDDIVEAASQNYHVVVDRAIGVAAGDAPMTIDDARAVVYALLAVALGEGPDTPGVGKQIEAYAAPMVSNVEGGLSNLITDLRGNPNYIIHRIERLEKKVA